MSESVKIYCVSDVHLEFQSIEPPKPEFSDCILVIAGDLGNPMLPSYKKYLTNASDMYQEVILVTGNHDYYSLHRTMAKTEEMISNITKTLPNVHLLNKSSVILRGIKFLGTTLWTDLTPVLDLNPCTNDFKMIKDLNLLRYQELHIEQRDWLINELSKEKCGPLVVVTHHPPSFSAMHPKYEHLGRINCYYYTNLDTLISKCDLWLCGHTHRGTLSYHKSTPLLLNPIGYPGEIVDYNPKTCVEIDNDNVIVHNFKGYSCEGLSGSNDFYCKYVKGYN